MSWQYLILYGEVDDEQPMRNFKTKPLHEKILIAFGIVLLLFFTFIYIHNFFSLGHAVVNNDVTRVKLLLKMGLAVNPTAGQTSFSPLRMAVSNGYKEICEILISHGDNINIEDEHGNTLLDDAILFKRNEVAKLLIEKGIQLNDYNLNNAAYHGNQEIAELLIKKGLNPNASLKFSRTINRDCSCCPTPLITAASNNHSEVAQLLIEHGAHINSSVNNCYTPLHAAASHRAMKTVKLLIHRGANVNAQDEQGHTPLFYATKNEDIDVQQVLIAAGAVRK
jgi:ankyrin repeat protein